MAETKNNKNSFLNADGTFNLVERFPGIDFMIYEEESIKKQKIKKEKQDATKEMQNGK